MVQDKNTTNCLQKNWGSIRGQGPIRGPVSCKVIWHHCGEKTELPKIRTVVPRSTVSDGAHEKRGKKIWNKKKRGEKEHVVKMVIHAGHEMELETKGCEKSPLYEILSSSPI